MSIEKKKKKNAYRHRTAAPPTAHHLVRTRRPEPTPSAANKSIGCERQAQAPAPEPPGPVSWVWDVAIGREKGEKRAPQEYDDVSDNAVFTELTRKDSGK